jgi:transcriptional antiterminator RfaH
MNSFVPGWYLIYTKPRREKKVTQELSCEKIHFYLPTLKAIRNVNKRKRVVDIPLFPSYVFVYLQSIQDYYISLGVDGTLYYVRLGKKVARVSDNIIYDLKILLEKGQDMEVSTDYFKPSQKLLVQQGPFTGLSCEVIEYKDKKKILVRINLLNRCVLVDMPANHLTEATCFPVSI